MLNEFEDTCVNKGAGSAGSGERQSGQGETDGYSGGMSLGTSDSYPLGMFPNAKVSSDAIET